MQHTCRAYAIMGCCFRHVQVGLAAPNAKGRLEPSRTGAFIAALPLSLESSLLLACGGLAGHAWEACLLAALMNATPYRIQQPFGSAAMKYVTLYYYGPDSQGAAGGAAAAVEAGLMQPDSAAAAAGVFGYDVSSSSGRQGVDRTVQLLANLAAFEAWQQQWCDVQRLKQLLQVEPPPGSGSSSNGGIAVGTDRAGADAAADARSVLSSAAAAIVSNAEAAWCRQHHLLPASLRHVQDTLTIIVSGGC